MPSATYFEHNGHFLSVSVLNKTVIIRSGDAGVPGTRITKRFSTPIQATHYAAILVGEKRAAGYQPVDRELFRRAVKIPSEKPKKKPRNKKSPANESSPLSSSMSAGESVPVPSSISEVEPIADVPVATSQILQRSEAPTVSEAPKVLDRKRGVLEIGENKQSEPPMKKSVHQKSESQNLGKISNTS